METLKKERNFSFLHKKADYFDSVYNEESKDKYIIPAPIGSTYWAILRYMFQNLNKTVTISDLTEGVDLIMKESNPLKWEQYCNKKKTIVFLKLSDTTTEKKSKTWQMRIIGNAKTLTRESSYGKRLKEIGYKLNYKSSKKEPFFILNKI